MSVIALPEHARAFLMLLAPHEHGTNLLAYPQRVTSRSRRWCSRRGFAKFVAYGPGKVDSRWCITDEGRAALAGTLVIEKATSTTASEPSSRYANFKGPTIFLWGHPNPVGD